jgi:hypothetical protein
MIVIALAVVMAFSIVTPTRELDPQPVISQSAIPGAGIWMLPE